MKDYGNVRENHIGGGVYTIVLKQTASMTPDLWATLVVEFEERHRDLHVRYTTYIPSSSRGSSRLWQGGLLIHTDLKKK
jgi:hypothetical protein